MHKIPILREKQKPCSKYIGALETAIGADGCTGVLEIYHDCCVIHDLGYRFHIDIYGKPITKSRIDSNFRCCMQDRSIVRWFNPMSWWRYAAVKWFGGKFYTEVCRPFTTYYWR